MLRYARGGRVWAEGGGRNVEDASNLHRYLAWDYRDGYWSYARQLYSFDGLKGPGLNTCTCSENHGLISLPTKC